MIQETSYFIRSRHKGMKKVGLLAGTATISKQVYGKYFSNTNQSLLTPDKQDQEKVMKAIFDVKAGQFTSSKKFFIEVSHALLNKGAQGIVCGCTEVSVVLKEKDLQVPIIDPMQVIVEKSIDKARGLDRSE
jgi:aspartate racemase